MTPNPTPTAADQQIPQANPEKVERSRAGRWLASIASFGGALLFCDLAVHLFAPLGRGYFLVAGVMALCMPALPAAYWALGAVAPGGPRTLARIGTGIVAIGAAAWLAAFTLLFGRPEAAFTQHLTPAGSLLMAIGMLAFGSATLLSRRLTGVIALAPLAVGAYFPLQLIAQIAFFLGGKDDTPGPNGLLLGAWGLVWILAAQAVLLVLRQSEKRRC